MEQLIEVWKPVPGYEGYYEASNNGRIRSLDSYIKHPYGPFFKKGRILKPILTSQGYHHNTLAKDGKKKIFRTHRIILMTFVGKSSLQVNHINGIKSDNRLINLEYCTGSHNQRHAVKLGLRPIGETHPMAKLTREQVILIRNDKRPTVAIAKEFNIYKSTVVKIKAGLIWKSV